MSFDASYPPAGVVVPPPPALEQRLMAAVSRFAGGLLLLVVGVLWLSVMTWSVTDPSLTHATSVAARNLMGALGAIVSDLLLQTLGLGTIVMLVVPLFWGMAMLKAQGPTAGLSKSQFFWFPVAALASAGALSALPVPLAWPLHHGLGGIVGDTVFDMTAKGFLLVNAARGGIAAGLVLFAATAMSFSRAIGVTWPALGAAVASMIVRSNIGAGRPAEAAGTAAHLSGAYHAAASGAPTETMQSYQPYRYDAGRIEPQLMVPPQSYVAGYTSEMAQPVANTSDVAVDRQRVYAGLADRFGQAVASARYMAQRGAAAAQQRASQLGVGLHAAVVGRAGSEEMRAGYDVPPDQVPPHAAPSLGRPYAQRGNYEQHTGGWNGQVAASSPYRDADFDVTTEETSRAIARRFAPAGAAAHDRADAVEEDLPPVPSWNGAVGPLDRPNAAAMQTDPMIGGFDAIAEAAAPVAPGGNGSHVASAPTMGPAAAAVAHQPQSPPQTRSEAHVPQQPSATAHAPGRKPMTRNALLGGLTFRHQAQAGHKVPPIALLKKPVASKAGPEFTQTMLRGNARLLEDVLGDFGVKGEIRDIRPGPVVTLFEFEPARGVKSSRVIGLAEDIARSMSATSARVAVVPGRNAIGIELPNTRRDPVLLREVLESEAYKSVDSTLPIALGKSIGGEPVVADLARMPHLLVAGTTGSGKSVGVNAMILSLLYRLGPDDCRFLMIDPKMLELSVYNGIPHLLTPVVTDPQKAVTALNWVVGEMEERYKRMSKLSVRNIDVYNNRVRNAKKRGEMISRTVQTGFDRRTGEAVYEQEQMQLETMPYIVVVIDEFADLMLVAGKDVEASVQRLAQMARAAGIHIIMATQRPSVDVITGTIKANFPTRISFKVTSKIDSRTILNEQGAEQLLGQGDMLYAAGSGQIGRVHGAFVSDEEVEAITNHLRAQGAPSYVDGITEAGEEPDKDMRLPDGQGEEDLYDRAVAIVVRDRKASTSYLQRRLSIGYNRAADLIERMEADGLISAANHAGKREILASGGGTASGGKQDAA
ncbi:MAG: DNA translocase FtsK 4TM domain-containing protein [Hyphomicrobiaceae bacterium]|nr:DNA translocase FtsK 4TM domain-containing protein [Hyphomicrobiaceae bacterium]